MTDPSLATYSFLPWARRGAAAAISRPDTLAGSVPGRATLPILLTVENVAAPISAVARLFGPGDAIGMDARQIVRTEPRNLATDFEPTRFPAIEFASPELPWLLTPASANASEQLRPWICLVVVEQRPDRLHPSTPLPVLEIDDAGTELPNPQDLFAWAHVHVAGGLSSVDAALATERERSVSRLLCPRRLKPGTPYLACVVPSFLAGREAGLGRAPAEPPTLEPAWKTTDKALELPVYHHWEFTTGEAGDFGSLVQLLQPRPATVGTRPLDVSEPGPGLPSVPQNTPSVVLGLEGALRAPGSQPGAWPSAHRTAFQQALRMLLESPETRADTDPSAVLAPPIYGRWHAAKTTVPATTGRPHWLRQLNLDPRYRVAAALGVQVVQAEQEDLMGAAWEQVGEVERANEVLRRGQLARSAARSLESRQLARLVPGALLELAAPAATRVAMTREATLHAQVAAARLPAATLSAGFRRVTRPRGRLARRLRDGGTESWNDRPDGGLLARFDSGRVKAAPAHRLPRGGVSFDAVSIALAGAQPLLPPRLASHLRWRSVSEDLVLHAPPRSFAPVFGETPAGHSEPTGVDPMPAFRVAAAEYQAGLLAAPDHADRAISPRLGLTATTQTLRKKLDPAVTVPRRVRSRVRVGVWAFDDPLEPVMAAPRFDAPMYLPLREISAEWLLPGLGDVPPDTITLLETNERFLESYMVGLNHEVGRELLWRGYPTDQRGTYFRHFWDHRGRMPPPPASDPDRDADIDPIPDWPSSKSLGNSAGRGPAHGPELVLLLRGELLRRYPTATIYATPARWDGTGTSAKRVPSTDAVDERYPIFRGTFPPDATFLAFDLTEADARGGTTKPTATATGDPPGWFFVVQQQPTEPRFGLDEATKHETGPPTSPDKLSWGHLATDDAKLAALTHAPVTGSPPEAWSLPGVPAGVKWGGSASSAHIGYLTLKRPVRLAIHADDMLP